MAAGEETNGGLKWQDLEAPPFQKEVPDVRFVNVSIKCYEKKTGSGEYYAYKIVAILAKISEDGVDISGESRPRYEVWRRYSEFEMLRNFFSFVYPHVIVPPLPEKAIKGSVSLLNKMSLASEDIDFLMQRQQALEIFLVRVSRHPTLHKNVWFHKFLEDVSWKEHLLKSGFTGKGESMLQTLTLQLSKGVPDTRFQETKLYANDLESLFKSMLEIRERMNSSIMSIYKVHGNYGRVMNELSLNEDALGTALQTTSGCMDSYSESVDSYFSEEESRFLMPLKEYIGFCDSLRAVVRRHELLQKQLEKMEETVSNKAEAREILIRSNPETGGTGGKRFTFKNLSARLRGEDTSYEAQLATAEKELKEAEESLSNIQKEFEDFTQDALQEIEKFNMQKSGDFRSMLINYVQLQLHMHKKGIGTWQRVKEAFEATKT